MKRTAAGIMGMLLVLGGCSKPPERASVWTPPTKVTESLGGLGGGLIAYPYKNSVMALQSQRDGSAKCFFLSPSSETSNAWSEVRLATDGGTYVWEAPATDPTNERVMFVRGYLENDQLMMSVLLGKMTEGVGLRDAVERNWVREKRALFGETGPNVRLVEPGRRYWLGPVPGILSGSEAYVPYSVDAQTYSGNTSRHGPFNNGVFHSTDSGRTWEMERVSDFSAWALAMCRTKSYYYYFMLKGPRDGLWFSRKPVTGDSWTAPAVVAEAHSVVKGGGVIAEGDTVHLCWLDRRHERRRFNLQAPDRENYEVAYCRRRDSDANWSKDVLLSRGMLYSYAPSMAVEGNKIVVAWAGVPTAPDWHVESHANDIYFAASKDSGKTWTKPQRGTDNIKADITTGIPAVALLNGVIHLLYIQGKLNLKREASGLTKLNQPPWPIYYQRRTFPE